MCPEGHCLHDCSAVSALDTLSCCYIPPRVLHIMASLNEGSFAFAPSALLNEGKHSTLGTRGMALESPLPLVLAVYVADEDRSLSLFFVSELAAKRRKIPSGWYVMSDPGKKFYLTLTNMHEEGSVHFRGKKLEHGEVACGQLFVGGRNVQMGNRSYSIPAKEKDSPLSGKSWKDV